MSSILTTSISATATALLALSTPFIQPSGCESHWTLTVVPSTTTQRFPVATSVFMISVLVSKPVASCYPSGWDRLVPEQRFQFRPAVCPSGWTYYDMTVDNVQSTSSAFCCNRLIPSSLNSHVRRALWGNEY